MARREQTKGPCAFCHKELTRSGMARHLPTCAARAKAVEAAAQAPKELYHLQVQDAWGGRFWLHLEINGAVTLGTLDKYLRYIWLECCGHLSEFRPSPRGARLGIGRTIATVFGTAGTQLTHLYDFGTTSETLVTSIGCRVGAPLTKHPIFLMARNSPVNVPCMHCKQRAEVVCMECTYDGMSGLLCREHAESDPHAEDDAWMPEIVNSPRMGLCGYEGPADPPY